VYIAGHLGGADPLLHATAVTPRPLSTPCRGVDAGDFDTGFAGPSLLGQSSQYLLT
jgi:hypothetical protein